MWRLPLRPFAPGDPQEKPSTPAPWPAPSPRLSPLDFATVMWEANPVSSRAGLTGEGGRGSRELPPLPRRPRRPAVEFPGEKNPALAARAVETARWVPSAVRLLCPSD